MDSESYELESTAEIINENYVAIKVDRDERPDVDSRYQAAVGAISGQGGWPLTAFLTSDGRVYFGGTYFPPEDRYGRMGFPNLLKILAEAFRKEPEKVYQNAEQITLALQHRSDHAHPSSGLTDAPVANAVEEILSHVDLDHGGFGTAPKFPNTSGIELLLAQYDQSRNHRILDAVELTLRNMARGGIYDQLGGGFHRYSTDESWLVPHFEKMLYDNAALLINYVHAYQATKNPFYRDIAMDVVHYTDSVLSDRDRGGFFGSQDADVKSGDDGSYFTWSLGELRTILNEDEFKCVQRYFGLSTAGHMHGINGQNVLHREQDLEEIASSLGKSLLETQKICSSAIDKMSVGRSGRKTPFVDATIYADWNGMMICAYCEAYKAFQGAELKQFAVKTLDRIFTEHMKDDGTISHRASAIASDAFLGDQVEIADACITAYEVTSDLEYLNRADQLMQRTLKYFADHQRGGFFDLPIGQSGIGLLSVRNKLIQDSPSASANSVAISILNKLWILTDNSEFKDFAEKSLQYFAGSAVEHSLYASRYFLALHEFLYPPPHVAIVSDTNDAIGRTLFSSALAAYRHGKIVTFHSPRQSSSLPNALKNIAGSYSKAAAYVCTNFSCAPPAFTPDILVSTIESFGRNQTHLTFLK